MRSQASHPMYAATARAAFLLLSWLATAGTAAMPAQQQQPAARSLLAGGGGSALDRLVEDPSGWIPDLHSPGAAALGRPSSDAGNSSTSSSGGGPQLPPGELAGYCKSASSSLEQAAKVNQAFTGTRSGNHRLTNISSCEMALVPS